ncbi:hypothetical protein GGR25_004802 [Kaistia hirudinis]|uniref:Uncharacterized protein n=1 Tax=Kaistia hirudinis TaxID=1293440 RepID=A0A840AVS4_9HYPH|nr:hypothetical protein [Kaistia hirudinis]MBB3933724.1 hypothetical protein [Kaistia hirudinis]
MPRRAERRFDKSEERRRKAEGKGLRPVEEVAFAEARVLSLPHAAKMASRTIPSPATTIRVGLDPVMSMRCVKQWSNMRCSREKRKGY